MRYGIISDIHGNLLALEKVLERGRSEGCDKFICLGDIVGYGPFPNECVELVKNNCDIVLMGNHDHAAIGHTSTSYFNIYAKMAIEWTATELTPSTRLFLEGLPFRHEERDISFMHSTPVKPEEWNYVLNLSEAEYNLKRSESKMCFIGHSHVAVIFVQRFDGKIRAFRDGIVDIAPDSRYIINVGSVGQPRDGNPAASFGIYDTESARYQLIRQEYDVSKTQQAMMERDLPYFLVERLSRGQ